MKIWVQATNATVPREGAPRTYYSQAPQEVERTFYVTRRVLAGELRKVDPPAPASPASPASQTQGVK